MSIGKKDIKVSNFEVEILLAGADSASGGATGLASLLHRNDTSGIHATVWSMFGDPNDCPLLDCQELDLDCISLHYHDNSFWLSHNAFLVAIDVLLLTPFSVPVVLYVSLEFDPQSSFSLTFRILWAPARSWIAEWGRGHCRIRWVHSNPPIISMFCATWHP